METGAATTPTGNSFGYTGPARLHPSGTRFYTADVGLSPADIRRYDFDGTSVTSRDSPYHGDYAMCGNLWISEDGSRIFTACGNTFRSTSLGSTDMTYSGKLEGTASIGHLDHSAEAARILAVPTVGWGSTGKEDTTLLVFEDTYLTQVGTVAVSPFLTPAGSFAGHGRYVFFSADGTRRYALVQADASSGMLKDFGLMAF